MHLTNLLVAMTAVVGSVMAVPAPTNVHDVAARAPAVTGAPLSERQTRLPLPNIPWDCVFKQDSPNDIIPPLLGDSEQICAGILGAVARRCEDREAAGAAALTQCLLSRTSRELWEGACRCINCGLGSLLSFGGVWNDVCGYIPPPPVDIFTKI
ncbi:hypothetical protein QBC40DRAFT_348342 [Triangularia verruculosa]|uniref:Uncharacterized protein n=1 Tax=Triangularia verruculosa TaxID=2587418 RepID=A0AAN6XI83_9PEZI|nr:hypothetical protein QBC40DRAFT_348342 [Triangularia verruculosa]